MSKLSFEKYLSSKFPINVLLSLFGLRRAGVPSVTRCTSMTNVTVREMGGALSWVWDTPRHQILSTNKIYSPEGAIRGGRERLQRQRAAAAAITVSVSRQQVYFAGVCF